MTNEYRREDDAGLDASPIAIEMVSVDRAVLDGDGATQCSVPSDGTKDLRAQILRTPPEEQMWSGGGESEEPETVLDDDKSIWRVYGPFPGNVSGILIRTKSGACIRVLNPDADVSGRWLWIPDQTPSFDP